MPKYRTCIVDKKDVKKTVFMTDSVGIVRLECGDGVVETFLSWCHYSSRLPMRPLLGQRAGRFVDLGLACTGTRLSAARTSAAPHSPAIQRHLSSASALKVRKRKLTAIRLVAPCFMLAFRNDTRFTVILLTAAFFTIKLPVYYKVARLSANNNTSADNRSSSSQAPSRPPLS